MVDNSNQRILEKRIVEYIIKENSERGIDIANMLSIPPETKTILFEYYPDVLKAYLYYRNRHGESVGIGVKGYNYSDLIEMETSLRAEGYLDIIDSSSKSKKRKRHHLS